MAGARSSAFDLSRVVFAVAVFAVAGISLTMSAFVSWGHCSCPNPMESLSLPKIRMN